MNPMQSPNVGPGGADFGKRERFSEEPEPDQFRVGDVWENSRGTPHTGRTGESLGEYLEHLVLADLGDKMSPPGAG